MRILKALMFLFAASALLFPATSEAQTPATSEAQKAPKQEWVTFKTATGQTVKLRSTMVGKERMVLVPLKGCILNTPFPPYCWLQ
jgi:hypothetical protein